MVIPLVSHSEKLKAINVYGYETELAFQCGLSCCWVKPNDYYIQKVVDMGFNSIRLPFSAEYIHRGDLTSFDHIIQQAEDLNLTIILDYHRTWSGHQGNWYETNLNEFQQTWKTVLQRYIGYFNVKYVDLYNEFQDGSDKASFWNDIMTKTIVYLEQQFPNRFIWVVGGTNWGGSLAGIHVNVSTEIDKRVMYTIHKYQWSVSGNYEEDYRRSFGGYSGDKLLVGEYGWIQSNEQQRQWGIMFLDYLKQHNVYNTALWCLSYYSGDTQGILKQNCLDVEEEKLEILKRFWS